MQASFCEINTIVVDVKDEQVFPVRGGENHIDFAGTVNINAQLTSKKASVETWYTAISVDRCQYEVNRTGRKEIAHHGSTPQTVLQALKIVHRHSNCCLGSPSTWKVKPPYSSVSLFGSA